MKKLILLSALLYFASKITYAQPGELDPSFGNGGIVPVPAGVTVAAVQSNGKILVAGNSSISRYNTDGSLDKAFGINGVQTTNFDIVSIVIRSDDKIIVAGSTHQMSGTVLVDVFVAQFNSDGSTDKTFNGTGQQNTSFNGYAITLSLAMQSDGKIVIAGYSAANSLIFFRFNSDGSLDNTFNGNGKLDTNIELYGTGGPRSMLIQTDGKIVFTAGFQNNMAVWRFNTDGTLDNTFDGDGLKKIFDKESVGLSVAMQKDGKLIVTGFITVTKPYESADGCIARLNVDGSFDSSFSGDGKLQTDFGFTGDQFCSSVTIGDDGKIYIGGVSANENTFYLVLARYSSDGVPDNTFSGDGIQLTPRNTGTINDLAIFDNKLYAVLYSNAIARYQLDGAYSSITSPANNSIFNAPATINIEASAYSPDATVTKVEFYNGATLLHTDDTSPYSFNWTNVGIGNYALTAKAIYSAGDPITSQQVHVSVLINQPPTISFQSPSDNASYDGPATIMLKANAEDSRAGGAVSKVEFFNGATLLATLTTSPYDFNWTNVSAGNYTITAKATGNTGLTASAIVHVLVTGVNEPTFGFNFNGTDVFNINNGSADPSESASLLSCNGGQYTTSGHFNSSSSNLYSITIVTSGGKLIIDGNTITDGTSVITAAELTGSAGTHTITLATPGVEGSFIQTITPFTDENNNKILDAGDIAGDPIVFTHTAAASAQTWYLDADGDQHASASKRSCTSPGTGWTLTVLPVDDCNDNDVTPCSNRAPAVNLITPTDNKIYLKGANVYIIAEASDVDGTISTIEYYSDNKLLHTETDVPQHSFITYKWPRVPLGNHTLTAKATDNGGLVTTSAPIHISVVHNQPPAVNLISPANEENFIAPATIYLEAAATDADGRITKVEFYNGSTLLQTSRVVPYHHLWKNVPAGTYTITAIATDNWGAKTTSAPLTITATTPVIKPTFGYNFNGTNVFNINNGTADPSESASLTLCDGGQYTTSGHFNSTSSNLYSITYSTSGSKLIIDGNTIVDGTNVISATQLTGSAGTHTQALATPDVEGGFIQTITPFLDLNNNSVLDAGDLAGDPIVFTHTATPAPIWYLDADGDQHASASKRSCTSPGTGWTLTVLPVDDCNDNDVNPCSKPTFGYNFNGTNVFNINNGTADPSESASLTLCDGGQYTTSGHFNSTSSNLYSITYSTSGSKLIIDGNTIVDGTNVITAADLIGSAGTHTQTLATPDVEGSFIQTITPFLDLNNNSVLDAGDLAGDPIVFTHTATPCNSKTSVVNIKTSTSDATYTNGSVSLKVTPNPANSIVNISTAGLQKSKETIISIISSSGVLMKSIKMNSSAIQLNVASLPSGVHTIRLTNGNKVLYKKFVKL